MSQFLLRILIIVVFISLPAGAVLATGNNSSGNLRIVFKGFLTDSQGQQLEDGEYNMKFQIYPDSEGGQAVWQEAFVLDNKVQVVEGYFRVTLGRLRPLVLDFENKTYWLGVTVGGQGDQPAWDEEMRPRKKIISLRQLVQEQAERRGSQEQEENLIRRVLNEVNFAPDTVVLIDAEMLKNALQGGEGSNQQINQASEAATTGPTQSDSLLGKIFPGLFGSKQTSKNEAANQREAGPVQFTDGPIELIKKLLNSILNKLSQITETLLEMAAKLDAIYQAVVSDEGAQQSEYQEQSIQEKSNQELAGKILEAGSALFAPGEDNVSIASRYIKENSKILIIFQGEPPSVWWISDKVSGKYFTLSLEKPVEQALAFDWWLLEGKSNVEANPPQKEQQEDKMNNTTSTQNSIENNTTSTQETLE